MFENLKNNVFVGIKIRRVCYDSDSEKLNLENIENKTIEFHRKRIHVLRIVFVACASLQKQ